jgi:plastocyanin
MRKFAAFALPLLLILTLGATGCGKTGSGTSSASSGTVQLTSDNFAVKSVTINAGQSVTYVNPSTGVVHILCVGRHQSCDSSITGGPPDLSGGKSVEFDAGNTKSYTFPTAGTYPVTCTVHTNMDMTVTVK